MTRYAVTPRDHICVSYQVSDDHTGLLGIDGKQNASFFFYSEQGGFVTTVDKGVRKPDTFRKSLYVCLLSVIYFSSA